MGGQGAAGGPGFVHAGAHLLQLARLVLVSLLKPVDGAAGSLEFGREFPGRIGRGVDLLRQGGGLRARLVKLGRGRRQAGLELTEPPDVALRGLQSLKPLLGFFQANGKPARSFEDRLERSRDLVDRS